MEDSIDLERFPIHRPDSPEYRALIQRCRQALHDHGMFNLEGFLRPGAIDSALSEIKPLLDSASFLHQREHNIYFKSSISDVEPDHPSLIKNLTSNYTICADQINTSILIQLYEWPAFAEFLAAAMGRERLYCMEDPLARLNVMAYKQGQSLNWHFDRSEFTTTLLLQSPSGGGEFEYRTGLRSDDNPNYDGVAKLLSNQDPQVQVLKLNAGTLNVFKGKHTAHRVTPVVGESDRIIAVFSYFQKPGVIFSDEERIGFYGRAA